MRAWIVARPLLFSTRLVGFASGICALVLWVVFLIRAASTLGEPFGFDAGTLVVAASYATLALVAASAFLFLLPRVLVSASVLSLPVGPYSLGVPDPIRWIGVCHLLCLVAGLAMLAQVRLARPARRQAAGDGPTV